VLGAVPVLTRFFRSAPASTAASAAANSHQSGIVCDAFKCLGVGERFFCRNGLSFCILGGGFLLAACRWLFGCLFFCGFGLCRFFLSGGLCTASFLRSFLFWSVLFVSDTFESACVRNLCEEGTDLG